MDGGANRVCVGDHAGTAAFGLAKRHPAGKRPRANADHAVNPGLQPNNLQFYAFGFLDGNLGVPKHFHWISRENGMLGKFLRDESGATAIEYSLLAGFIALAIIAAVRMTGERLITLFESLIPALTLP